jgi:vancomycin permeability regulator SanA
MAKNNQRKIRSQPVLVILIIILDLTFLYHIKYSNQNLTLSDLDLFNFGNLINLFFAILLITGLLIVVLKKANVFNSKIFFPVFLINQFLLIIIYFLKFISLPFKEIYYFGQSGDELFIGAIFAFYTLTFLIMIFLIWLFIFNYKNILVLRAFVNSILTLLVILVLVFFFIVGRETGFKENFQKNDKNNVGVVLGAAVWSKNKPSPSLASRVDKALTLFEQKKISQIYLTGSNAPGELAESEVALEYIRAKGVNTSEIFLEKETTSTNEQMQYIKNNFIGTPKKNVIVISDSYHLVRVLEIAKFHKIKIQVSTSELFQSFEKAVYNKIREALALTMFWLYAL